MFFVFFYPISSRLVPFLVVLFCPFCVFCFVLSFDVLSLLALFHPLLSYSFVLYCVVYPIFSVLTCLVLFFCPILRSFILLFSVVLSCLVLFCSVLRCFYIHLVTLSQLMSMFYRTFIGCSVWFGCVISSRADLSRSCVSVLSHDGLFYTVLCCFVSSLCVAVLSCSL